MMRSVWFLILSALLLSSCGDGSDSQGGTTLGINDIGVISLRNTGGAVSTQEVVIELEESITLDLCFILDEVAHVVTLRSINGVPLVSKDAKDSDHNCATDEHPSVNLAPGRYRLELSHDLRTETGSLIGIAFVIVEPETAELENRDSGDQVTDSNVKVIGEAPAVSTGDVLIAASNATSIAAHNSVAAQQQTGVDAQAGVTMGVATLFSLESA